MEKIRPYYTVMILLLLFCLDPVRTFGQLSPFDPGFSIRASQIKEGVQVFTDRSLYLVNEQIQFRADHLLTGTGDEKPWSRVLYVELVTSSGTSLARGKYEISKGLSTGALQIPANVLTGSYFLKCYTRWMRNAGPGAFSYTPLRVVNPFQREVERQEDPEAETTDPMHRSLVFGILGCIVEKPVVERGGEVLVTVSLPKGSTSQKLNGCLTAVPACAVDSVFGPMHVPFEGPDPEDFLVRYLPDRQGASLSGTIVRTDLDNTPSPFTKLHFSLLGSEPDYFATLSNLNGRFAVTTPAGSGVQEFFVAPEPRDQENIEVRIDQDFDGASIRLKPKPFLLSPEEKEVAEQMALRMQLAETFKGPALPQAIKRDSIRPFYGTPVQSLNLADWITLPTLEEVFINLVPDVYVVRRRNKASFRIHGANNALEIYSPLILIDHIPVFDQDAVASIPPDKIERLDVINEVYVKGNVTYGGLISIWTKKGDMAGIDLPEGSYFFDYQAMGEPILPGGSVGEGDRIPDHRNTLYWLPDFSLDPGTTKEISFRAPELPGLYLVLVRTQSELGGLISARATFTVK